MPRKDTSLIEEAFIGAWNLGKASPRYCLAYTAVMAILLVIAKWIWLPSGPFSFLIVWLLYLAVTAGIVGTINGYVHHVARGKRLESQHSLESIRALTWHEFELLVADAYRRKGFQRVVETGGNGDGGIDIVLYGPDSIRVAVQCKQWKRRSIGEPQIRDFLGAVTHQQFDRGIFVTSNFFTAGARAVGEKNRIELVDGQKLLQLVRDVQVSSTAKDKGLSATPRRQLDDQVAPSCPHCGLQMTVKTARKGQNPGSQFWGCISFPNCRGTRPIQ